ncbi:MAG: hypothetical protein ACLR4W_01430 [Oscillospiraceae bacterium]
MDESVEEKVPISEKILPRSRVSTPCISRPQARNQIKSFLPRSRVSTSAFRARRREINEIVFAALARIRPLHFAPAGAKPN